MSRFQDAVIETSTSVGTGAFTLLGPVATAFSMTSAFAASVPFTYVILDATDREIGTGYLNASASFVRQTVQKSTNSNNRVIFAAGTKRVYAALSNADIDEIRSVPHRWVANGPYKIDTSVDGTFVAPMDLVLVSATLHRLTAGTSGTTAVDLLKGGVSMFTTKPAIAAATGNNAVSTNAVFASTSVASGALLTVDLTSIEAGTPRDWSLTIRGI